MRFLYQLGFILAPKTYQHRVLEGSWGVLGASWRPLGASWARLGASWTHLRASWSVLEASWSVLGASWGVLGRKIGFPFVLKRKKRERGVQERSSAWPLGTNKYERRRNSTAEKLPTDLYRPPYNARRHAAGRLRAWCGSRAQQSCVSATALEPK